MRISDWSSDVCSSDLVVDRDAVMAAEREFQTAAERGAVERRNHRPAAGFELAQEYLEVFGKRISFVGIRHREHLLDVGAGENFLLAGRHDHALDRKSLV